MKPHQDQFSGCLIGQCLGDALGFVVEGFSPAACERYVEDFLKTGRFGEFGRFPFPFGQYSDDSQLARELLQSFAARSTFDPEDYAERIMRIFAEQRIVGFGYSTKEAVKRLFQGIPWHESGAPPPSAGNGSAMRAAPVGLMYFDDPQALLRTAHDQGRITHRDPRCSAGAVAVSGAVAQVLGEKSISPGPFIATLAEWTRTVEPEMASEIEKLPALLTTEPREAAAIISQAGIDAEYIDDEEWKGISSFVVSSVLWSLYAFLRTPEDYIETIYTAIAAGGDTDTTAAMAGAVSGAYLGIGAIPTDLSRHLTDRETWGFDELVGLAHQCYEIKMKSLA
jgi:ADP-ribosylglycohydrolase